MRTLSALLVLAACVSCDRTRAITVEFYSEDGYRFSQAERDTIEDIADAAIPEVRRFLPSLPNDVLLKVYPGRTTCAAERRAMETMDDIAEQASRASGKTAAQLVKAPTDEVLRLAGYSPSTPPH